MSQIRRLERAWKKKGLPQGTPERDLDPSLPACKITEGIPTGNVLAFPLIGFLADTAHGKVFRIHCLMFRSVEDPALLGACLVDYPVGSERELALVNMLSDWGWDGRIWPRDPGWPDGDDETEKSMLMLAVQHGIAHTVVFPSGDLSSTAQAIALKNHTGWFNLDPTPEVQEVDLHLLECFRALTVDTFKPMPVLDASPPTPSTVIQ